MLTHQQKIVRVADRVRSLRSKSTRIRIYHGSTNSTRTLRFKKEEIIDVSDLNRVLWINKEKQSVLVEPNVPMDELVSQTIKHGLIPAVVPEFPGITVGGAVAGGSGESSSFRYGLVHNLALSYEVVLGSGEIISVSPKQNANLFFGMGGTCGSLGIITAIEITLIPATKYIRLEYIPVANQEELTKKVSESSLSNADFVDAIIFSKNEGVVMVGYRTDVQEGLAIRHFSRSWDEWFYLHAQKMSKHEGGSEIIPIQDYLFRYDRGAFWMGHHAFKRFHVSNNRLTRFLFDPLLKTRMMYRGLQEAGVGQEYIIQDVSVPMENVDTLLYYIHTALNVYPIWLLPITPKAFSNTNIHTNKDFIINVGIWSASNLSYDKFVEMNIALEEKVTQLGGCKGPYGHFYSEETLFWKNLNKSDYEELRRQYHADEAFPSIYEKIRVREKYIPTVKKGFFRALRPRWRLPLS